MSLSSVYFTRLLGLVHLLRLLSLLVLLIFAEIRLSSSCPAYLNEFLGYNHQSILFYYILIWISFAFEIYFLLNRLLGSVTFQARRSSSTLYALLGLAFLLAASFTLYALITRSDGHLITEHDLGPSMSGALVISSACNQLRWTGVVLGYVIGLLYLLGSVFICRSKDVG